MEKLKNLNSNLVQNVASPPIVEFWKMIEKVQPQPTTTYNMAQAVPAYPTFEKIRRRVSEEVLKAENSYYTEVPGLLELRKAIVKSHPLKNIKPEQVLVTAGANNALYSSLKIFFEAGDSVALVEPSYFNYEMALKILEINPLFLRTDPEDQFQFQSQKMIQQLEKLPAVKGVILITPNNPTGALYQSSELVHFLNWTRSKGIHVLLDETYGVFDSNHLNNPQLETFLGENLHLVGSFSKSYSLTGYRVGYFISSPQVLEQALKIQDTQLICAPRLSQIAALSGLLECKTELQNEINQISELYKFMLEKKSALKKFEMTSVGPFFAYLRHPYKNLNSFQAAEKLFKNTGLLSLPGEVFGPHQAPFLRLAYCNFSIEKLGSAMEALVQEDQSHS